MSTTGRANESAPAPSDVAGRLEAAGFVRLVGAATGDALAASGVVARALAALDRPFQVSLAPFAADAARATDADLTVAIGRHDSTADLDLPGRNQPASETAFAVARALVGDGDGSVAADGSSSADDHPVEPGDAVDSDVSPTALETDETVALALAGVVADGRVGDSDVAAAAREAGLERRPGLAVPADDVADGLAHSTLVHGSFSGDAADAADFLAERGFDDAATTDLSEADRRRLASLVAIEAVGADDVPARAGDAVERVLRPFAGGPLETVGGYGDVLDAVARERPGTGVALALGHDVAADALDAWRAHARRAHAAVRSADTGRHDGLFVVRPTASDAPVATVARLVHAYRSPEHATLVATDGAAAVVGDDTDVGPAIRSAAAAVDGTGEASGTTGRARYDGDAEAFVAAAREALE